MSINLIFIPRGLVWLKILLNDKHPEHIFLMKDPDKNIKSTYQKDDFFERVQGHRQV